jgi:hypothetical protein
MFRTRTKRPGAADSIGAPSPQLLAWSCWLILLVGARAPAQDDLDARGLLQRLNEASIDPAEIYVVRNVQITRDRANFYFNRGFVGFLAPVQGEVTGAVFAGDGEVLLMPPDPIEKASLVHFTQAAVLEERFSSAYLRFTDQTALELKERLRRPDPDDAQQPGDFALRWDPIVRKLNPEYSMRVLTDLLGERDQPCFLAYVQGTNLGTIQVEVDERVPEAVRVGAIRRVENRTYSDIWCSFASKKSTPRLDALTVGSLQVVSYKLETRIHPDNSLEGRAELTAESRSSRDRAVTFELSRFLKVTEARDEDGKPLTVFQNPAGEEPETVRRSNDWIVVILPRSYPVGERFKLHFSYQGNVIADAGNGVLHVGERSSWYPNRGALLRADFDLTFHYPERLTLVATGERVEETTADGWKHSRWVSRKPQPVAGFNLGAYRSCQRRVGGVTIDVFATREVEAAIEKRNLTLQPMVEVIGRVMPNPGTPVATMARSGAPLDPAALLDSVADITAETVTRYEALFGPLQISRLAITQVPGHFGQGWPGLVYLPTMSFLPKVERLRLGLDSRSKDFANELTLAHEIAHQWWGNHVGWLTYRDQWLSEGFATYSAALQLASGKDGERKLRGLLREYKADLLAHTPSGATVESGGPILLGQRLSNSLNPEGYTGIIYKKACWVIHMLRALMADGSPEREERFFRMLRQFIATYQGKHACTQDFIRHAEKYMTRSMDLERNQRLDWFFSSWVYGTGIPTYKLEYDVKRTASRKYSIQGTIEQSNVPPHFEMPVPLVAHYGKDRVVRLGWVAVGEGGGRFRFTTAEKPARVVIDDDNILALIK